LAKRTDKLAKQLQRDLGEIIDAATKQLLKGTMVTIMDVTVTADLGLAKVQLSLFNTPDKQADMEILNQQIPRIRHFLAAKLKNQVRKIPNLVFYLDERIDQVEHMENLLKKLRKSED
jgi:ribosome-binding factor A